MKQSGLHLASGAQADARAPTLDRSNQCQQSPEAISYCVVKIDFGIMPWMPLVPSTTWVTW
jgi:hypothetical protein